MLKNYFILFIYVQEIAKIAHAYGAILFIDNSVMSPVLSNPLDLGAGIYLYHTFKYTMHECMYKFRDT